MTKNSVDFPLMECSVATDGESDEPSLARVVADVIGRNEDAFSKIDPETQMIVVGGRDEFHLDTLIGEIVARLKAQNVGVAVSGPQIAYREKMTRVADVDYVYDRQVGGVRQFARVRLLSGPQETGAGNVFVSTIEDGVLPNVFIRSIEKGIQSVVSEGVLIGFPINDVRVTLLEASGYVDISSAPAFELAGREAMRKACERAGMGLLEPVMNVEITTPEEFVGRIVADVDARRGQVRGQQILDDKVVVLADVPLANMFGYVNDLARLTKGGGQYRMTFSSYREMPRNVVPDPDDFPPAVAMRA